MAALSDLSLEFGHVSLASLSRRRADLAARTAARWAMPLVDAYEGAGLTVSTTILLDDYFVPPDADISRSSTLLSEACKRYGVRVDHLVHESEVAESVEMLHAQLDVEKPHSATSRSGSAPRWLESSDFTELPRSPRSPGARQSVRPAVPGELANERHVIALRLELHSDEIALPTKYWSCAMLAAWWQLIRLGLLIDPQSNAAVAPPRTESSSGAPAFAARRTLSLLEPRFLPIEHAVRAILEQIALPEDWLGCLWRGESPADRSALLARIAYFFVPTSFMGPGVHTKNAAD